MKRTTYIKSISGSTIHMTDGSAWEVALPWDALRSSPPLLPATKVETEDVGPEKSVTVLNSGQVLKARKLRAVA
jgi:hypothetical protein